MTLVVRTWQRLPASTGRRSPAGRSARLPRRTRPRGRRQATGPSPPDANPGFQATLPLSAGTRSRAPRPRPRSPSTPSRRPIDLRIGRALTTTTLRWARRSLDALLLVAVVVVIVTAGITVLAPVLGGRALVIGGGSMEPTIPQGALVLALPVGRPLRGRRRRDGPAGGGHAVHPPDHPADRAGRRPLRRDEGRREPRARPGDRPDGGDRRAGRDQHPAPRLRLRPPGDRRWGWPGSWPWARPRSSSAGSSRTSRSSAARSARRPPPRRAATTRPTRPAIPAPAAGLAAAGMLGALPAFAAPRSRARVRETRPRARVRHARPPRARPPQPPSPRRRDGPEPAGGGARGRPSLIPAAGRPEPPTTGCPASAGTSPHDSSERSPSPSRRARRGRAPVRAATLGSAARPAVARPARRPSPAVPRPAPRRPVGPGRRPGVPSRPRIRSDRPPHPPRRSRVRRRLAVLVVVGLVVGAAAVAFAGTRVVLARFTDAAAVTGSTFATGSLGHRHHLVPPQQPDAAHCEHRRAVQPRPRRHRADRRHPLQLRHELRRSGRPLDQPEHRARHGGGLLPLRHLALGGVCRRPGP